jgi:hypothetical protein
MEVLSWPQLAQEFVAKVGATFPIVNDDQSLARRLFQVTGTPTNLMIDQSGRVFFRTIGFAPGHEKIYEAQIDYLLERGPKMGALTR